MKLKVVHAYLSSWAGISIGARHWYVELKGIRASHQLSAPISDKEARERNKDMMARTGGSGYYKAGDLSERFETRDAAIEHSRKVWRRMFRGYDLLVLGSSSSIEPKSVLDAVDPKLGSRMDAMAERFRKARGSTGGYGWNKTMDRLSREWGEMTR